MKTTGRALEDEDDEDIVEFHVQYEVLAPFAARVAHDFNNLLTGILGNLELLQLRAARQNLPGLEAYLAGASSAGARAAAFAARLMQFSGQAGAGHAPVAADELLTAFASAAECRLAAGGAVLMGDAAALELAIAELLANAEAAGGRAIITSARQGGRLVITVSDDGHGMPPETLAQACAPFFSTAPSGTGRGLGLAIVARVVRDHGGEMSIAAAPGAGCRVTLRLPCV